MSIIVARLLNDIEMFEVSDSQKPSANNAFYKNVMPTIFLYRLFNPQYPELKLDCPYGVGFNSFIFTQMIYMQI